jgi:7,8-dihydro-6-hydroxymethylpterin dimethyltransferase
MPPRSEVLVPEHRKAPPHADAQEGEEAETDHPQDRPPFVRGLHLRVAAREPDDACDPRRREGERESDREERTGDVVSSHPRRVLRVSGEGKAGQGGTTRFRLPRTETGGDTPAMTDRVRPYLFYGATVALCATCLRRVEAKEVIEDGRVYLLKRCPDHGPERVLLADDAAYWRLARERFLKPPEQVTEPNTPHRFGCPFDCGICPEHEQHGCVSLLEVTDHCNLRCPTCYASSGPERDTHRSLETIERMLDLICANEGEPDIVQVSGGEPTTHPQFFDILDACRRRPIRHLMVNTNGVRIAKEDGFAERLARYMPGFEIYLQMDSLRREAVVALRGGDTREIYRRALDRLDALGLSTTLVMTVRRGTNDDEIGDVLRFALGRPCVRGVTIQPVQDAGRNDGFDAVAHRLTLTEVRRRIIEQSGIFAAEDVIPVPCNPDCLAMAYAIKRQGTVVPLTRLVDPAILVEHGRNTIVFESDQKLRAEVVSAFSTAHSPETSAASLKKLLCCLPGVTGGTAEAPLSYDQVFRVIIMQFLDRHSLDLRTVRRACVHIAHPDGRRAIPFDTYNVLYRGEVERETLLPLRRRADAMQAVF